MQLVHIWTHVILASRQCVKRRLSQWFSLQQNRESLRSWNSMKPEVCWRGCLWKSIPRPRTTVKETILANEKNQKLLLLNVLLMIKSNDLTWICVDFVQQERHSFVSASFHECGELRTWTIHVLVHVCHLHCVARMHIAHAVHGSYGVLDRGAHYSAKACAKPDE